MPSRRRFLELATGLCGLVAGCNAASTPTDTLRTTRSPSPTSTPSPTPESDDDPTPESDDGREEVVVENGSLPFDATRVFDRVAELLGVDARPPTVILDPETTRRFPGRTPFERRMGLAVPEDRPTLDTVGGGASPDRVWLLSRGEPLEEAPESDVELTLVHEFVHVVQYQQGGGEFGVAGDPSRQLRRALSEGGATYTTDAYARAYGVRWPDGRLPVEHRAHDYRTRPAWLAVGTGYYYFGARYLDRRLDAPDGLWEVYGNPPTSMEQVIHGPGVEAPAPLAVTTDAPDWSREARGRQGELVLRSMLRSELPREEAAAAATGWGNDALFRFDASDATGFTWVLRWDDAGAATAFEDALRAFVDRRREAVDGSFAVTRAAPETVVLSTGASAFVAAASADADDRGESVTITVDDHG